MNSDRIKEIQETTAYPKSVSVQQALLQVWNECAQKMYSEEEVLDILRKTHCIEKTSKMDSWITKWFEQFKKK